MAIGIDPKVDFAFKQLFGSSARTNITVHFLNAVLNAEPRIERVEILSPIMGGETEDDKLSVLDVLARDRDGRYLNIEMQTTVRTGMRQRLLYYTACLYVDQLYRGQEYRRLAPAIGVCVLADEMFPEVPDMHLDFRLRSPEQGCVLTSDLQVHTLELPKLRISSDNPISWTPLERWAYFLSRAEGMSLDEVARKLVDPIFLEAAEVLAMITQQPEDRRLYLARQKALRDEAWKLSVARDEGLAAGHQEGHDQGLKEGHEVGLKEGREAGRTEGREVGLVEGREVGLVEGREVGLVEGREVGLVEGRQEGFEKGTLAGRIQAMQLMLRVPVASDDELKQRELGELRSLLEDLQSQLGR